MKKTTFKDLYTYTLYEIKENNDIQYITEYETTEEIATELKQTKRNINRITYKNINNIDFMELYKNNNKYIVIKEQAPELLENII